MMRSLYSAVSGLKTHQTKMDVIGNNISNVNTVAFKSSSVTFSSIMYQTISTASGANASTGTGGTNAKQIGLGVTTGSTALSITTAGASETTGQPFDLRITDSSTSSFFIVNNGTENVFTKAGSFYVDGSGNLCMTSTGYTVMGWGVDSETGTIKKDTVSVLKIMSAENQTSSPEATTLARCTGVVDNSNTQITSSTGYTMNLTIYDNLGYSYTARFAIQAVDTSSGKYSVNLTDIIDSDGNSILNSSVSLASLFGTTTSSNAQGTCVNITDNYTFASGKNKISIYSAIQAYATSKAADGELATYTYYFDASDINAQLGLSGSNALPDGYRVKFTTTALTYDNALAALTAGNKKGDVIVENASGKTVAYGIATVIDDSDGNNISGVQWQFVDTDGNPCDYTLTQSLTLDDYTAYATTVTADDGTVGYMFDLSTIGSYFGLVEGTDYSDGDVIYYWPTYAGSTITMTDSSGEEIYFNSTVAKEDGNEYVNESEYATLIAYTGVEALLQDYSYTVITGSQLASATSTTGQIFTEELPSDAEVRYNVFSSSYTITTPSTDGYTLQFNTEDGTLTSIGGGSNTSQTLNLSNLTAAGYDAFSDVTIDFSSLLNYYNSGTNTAAMSNGDADGNGTGKKLGTMTGLTVDSSGKIYASYSNGNTELLGQIAVAQFANASGLEAIGDNCYRTTLNSGDFDGIGVEIDADGSSITSGELEMSNVDLATEFTEMITTQRGYQANSRVITTSDSMLEELINLKR